MSHPHGLRFKLNLMLVPLVAVTILVMGWLDYRHEVSAVMAAHALHAERVGREASGGPVDPATSPQAVARRSLLLHVVYGAITLLLLALALDAALTRFVLGPIDRIRTWARRATDVHARGTNGTRLMQDPAQPCGCPRQPDGRGPGPDAGGAAGTRR